MRDAKFMNVAQCRQKLVDQLLHLLETSRVCNIAVVEISRLLVILRQRDWHKVSHQIQEFFIGRNRCHNLLLLYFLWGFCRLCTMEVLFELDDVGVGADSLKNLGLAVHHALILQDLLHCHYFVGCLDAGLQKKSQHVL